MNSEESRFKKIVSIIFKKALSVNMISNVSHETLRKVSLFDISKLFIAAELNVDEEILQIFNAIINFILSNKDYVIVICVCVKIKSVL